MAPYKKRDTDSERHFSWAISDGLVAMPPMWARVEASPNNRKKGVGCPCCSGRVPKSGVNDLATLHPELLKEWDYQKNADLEPSKLLPGSGKRLGGNVLGAGMSGKRSLPAAQKGMVVLNVPGGKMTS